MLKCKNTVKQLFDEKFISAHFFPNCIYIRSNDRKDVCDKDKAIRKRKMWNNVIYYKWNNMEQYFNYIKQFSKKLSILIFLLYIYIYQISK